MTYGTLAKGGFKIKCYAAYEIDGKVVSRSPNYELDAALTWALKKIGSITGGSLTDQEYARLSLSNGTSVPAADDTTLDGDTVLNKDTITTSIVNGELKIEASVTTAEGNFTATKMALWLKDTTTNVYTLAHAALIQSSTKLNTQTGKLQWFLTMDREE